ncbi:hypothetical protein BDY21DRAFT_362103 [Lineolata rhizophorae]|uniref:Uncharacterized protein n=1 Tax=Lineolata rhizophorae TaxID=578093 RepID=A0A6A6P6B1_9PEZI|nr:hypothetical protein BDY21DRAFT_362103 [Lineolata rhizophorae]
MPSCRFPLQAVLPSVGIDSQHQPEFEKLRTSSDRGYQRPPTLNILDLRSSASNPIKLPGEQQTAPETLHELRAFEVHQMQRFLIARKLRRTAAFELKARRTSGSILILTQDRSRPRGRSSTDDRLPIEGQRLYHANPVSVDNEYAFLVLQSILQSNIMWVCCKFKVKNADSCYVYLNSKCSHRRCSNCKA